MQCLDSFRNLETAHFLVKMVTPKLIQHLKTLMSALSFFLVCISEGSLNELTNLTQLGLGHNGYNPSRKSDM